jgi:RNA polymerase sigma factor (sigma-70 family)
VEQVLAAPASEAPSEADASFEALYRELRDDLFAYVVGLLRDRHAAEDVTALAFERAYRRRARFDRRRGSPRAWLFAIARNAALDELRRRRHLARFSGEPADRPGAGPADEAAEVGFRRAALRDAIAALSARERELIALKFFAGLSNAEIAAVIGVSESNAGTRLHRVVTKLREACDEVA